MIRLKIILQSKITLIILILLTIAYVIFKCLNPTYSGDRFGTNTVTGVASQVKDDYIIIKDTVIYTDTTNIVLGQKYTCNGNVELANDNTNFNLFNYRKYLLSKKIYYVMDGNCEIVSSNMSYLYKIKNVLINKINTLKSARYIKAFILGDTGLIDDTVNDNYRKNGINHLFSISGMHVGFIIALFSFIKIKSFIVFILLSYLFLLGFPPSMSRAVFFYILLFVNKKVNLNIPNILLFIYLLCFVLLFNPYLVYSTGFIYSYVISFFLICFAEYFTDKNYVINTLKISIVIFIITIPINIQNNFYLNFMTPILNVIFIPIISFVLFPLSFIVLLFPFLDINYNLMCLCLENISNWCADNIAIIYPFHKMSLMVFIGYYVIIVWIMHKMKFREYKYLIVLILTLCIHALYPTLKNDGSVLMLDVGQGDSTLVIYPHNKLNILIDTGGYYSSNIVDNITIPTLYSYGITKLDYLILTHGDYDHMGEAINLVENFKVEKVIFNCGEFNDLEQELIKVLDKKKIKYYSCIKELNVDKNKLYFLQTKEYDNENDFSNVIYIELNGYKLMFMGDASITTEKEILSKYNLSDIDVLKVGHHGSKTSSSQEFIDKIGPKYSIISVGKNNRYGHPNNEVLNILGKSKIYRTDQDGSINVKIKNNKLQIEGCTS